MKRSTRRLKLEKQTLRSLTLSNDQLGAVQGGVEGEGFCTKAREACTNTSWRPNCPQTG
ncbi:MAG: hypothetical protein WKG01_21230 [Kofleriaceae bacterium]